MLPKLSNRVAGWLCAALLTLNLAPAFAQAPAGDAPANDAPFAVINFAGVDRWFENIDYVFQTIERPELSGVAKGGLSRVNDLKGLDRSRPLGLMLYLDAAFSVTVVGYLPVQDIDALAETLSIGPLTLQPVGGSDGKYELVGGRRKMWLQTQGEFAFISEKEAALERTFPDPLKLTAGIADRYDLAASADLERISEPTRQVLLALLRNGAEARLQQRDSESDIEYRIRRAGGMSNLEFLELALTHAQRLTLGWDVSPQNKRGVLELSLEARGDSPLADALQKVGGKASHFRGLLEEGAPFGVSISWQMSKPQKEAALEILKAAQDGVVLREAGRANADPDETSPSAGVFAPLIATAEQGHFDFFAQMSPTEQGKMILTGGLKVVNADALADGLQTWLSSLQGNRDLAELQLRADTHQGVALHRLVGSRIRRQDERIYGEKPGLALGAGKQALWFAVGGSQAIPALKALMDKVASRAETEPPQGGDPFRLVINMNSWRDFGPPPRPGRGQAGAELFREAFTAENDSLTIDIRPMENGARLRFEFDEGFLRMLGLGIARRYDRSQL